MKLNLKKAAIIEALVLLAALILLRGVVFPLIAGKAMLHVEIAVHIFMIGATITVFTAFALTVKRAWKTHGKYMLVPLIFNVFGILVQIAANDINF